MSFSSSSCVCLLWGLLWWDLGLIWINQDSLFSRSLNSMHPQWPFFQIRPHALLPGNRTKTCLLEDYHSTHYRHGVERHTKRAISQTNSWMIFLKGSSFSISVWNRVMGYPSLSKFICLCPNFMTSGSPSASPVSWLGDNYVFILGLSHEVHNIPRKITVMWFEVGVHEWMAKKEFLRRFWYKKVALLKHGDKTLGQKELHSNCEEQFVTYFGVAGWVKTKEVSKKIFIC